MMAAAQYVRWISNLLFRLINFEQDSSDEMRRYLEEKSNMKMYHSRVGQPQEKAVFLNCSYMLLHWLLNRFHSQKRFCRTFPCHTSTNHGFFGLFVCVMKKSITWNFIFFIHTIDTIVLSIEGNIHHKILFVLSYASLDWSVFSKSFPSRLWLVLFAIVVWQNSSLVFLLF